HIAAATIVGTGEVVTILNVLDLLRANGRVKATGHRPQATADHSPADGGRRTADFKQAQPAEKQSILVVDDSVTIRTFEKALLEAAGYDVTAASDGLEAWNMVQATQPDLIVSDVEMPNMTGFELTEKVRRDSR